MKEFAVRWLLWILGKQGNPSVIPWAFKQIRSLFRGEPNRYLEFLQSIYENNDNWLPKFFVAHEIGELIDTNTETVLQLLSEISKNEHEMVRQGAARSWSELLKYDFERFFPELEKMAQSDQYEERHTAALSPVRYFRETDVNHLREDKLKTFWESFADDPRQGLSNLVESQIVRKLDLSDE